mgnify:CR=1 FL=1
MSFFGVETQGVAVFQTIQELASGAQIAQAGDAAGDRIELEFAVQRVEYEGCVRCTRRLFFTAYDVEHRPSG